jgi:hypothetical protein
MPGLDPGIHSVALAIVIGVTEWIAGSSPAMTTKKGGAYPAGFIKYGCTAPDACGVTSTVSANTIGCTY